MVVSEFVVQLHPFLSHLPLFLFSNFFPLLLGSDGIVYQYNALGREVGHFECMELLENQKVIDCQFWASGVALMSLDLKIVCAALDRDDHTRPPHLSRMQQSSITIPPPCWIVIPPDTEAGEDSHDCLALLAMDATGEDHQGGVCAVDAMSYQEHAITKGTITKMALSPGGKLLAFFESTCVNVVFADFSQNIAQFDTQSEVPPDQMQWCGSDCVMLAWNKLNLAIIIGPRGEWLKYDFDVPTRVFTECDSLRLISADLCETLERVPDVTEEIFSSGSLSPGSLLYSALGHFEEKNPKANDNLRAIFAQLPEAVDTCVNAATLEFCRKTQRKLLRAASLGKAFAESYSSDRFVNACKTLRVLNAVRDFEVGIPLTYEQLQKLTMNGLITRLMQQNKHLLAVRICESMGLSPRRVYTHWACQKVCDPRVDESTIGGQIRSMLQDKPGIPYAEIAEAAFTAHHVDLATKLIEYEPRACDQVPLLYKMGKYDIALDKALESGDTDLAYDVIQKLRHQDPKTGWFDIIRSRPCALNLLMNLFKEYDEEMLVKVLQSSEMHAELAEHLSRKAFQTSSVEEMTSKLREAGNEFIAAQQRDGSYAFAARVTQDQVSLLLQQRDKEIATGQMLCGKSLAETVRALLLCGDMKGATKFKSEFKMSDKKFWWLRVQAIAENSKEDIACFNQLERLAKEKKSPIGYEPFADVCIDGNLPEEAVKYINMIPELPKRIPYYVRIGKIREATECALKTKDPQQYLRIILPACKKPEDRALVESMFQLGAK